MCYWPLCSLSFLSCVQGELAPRALGTGCGRYASALRIYWARGAACALAIGRGSCGDRCARNALPAHKLSCTESTRPVCRSLLGTGALFVLSDGVSWLVPLVSRILLCALVAPRDRLRLASKGRTAVSFRRALSSDFPPCRRQTKSAPRALYGIRGALILKSFCLRSFGIPPPRKVNHAAIQSPSNLETRGKVFQRSRGIPLALCGRGEVGKRAGYLLPRRALS